MTWKRCRELSNSFLFTAREPCLNNCTSNTYDLLSGSKCGSPWQQLSMAHHPRSSHGDKVLNRPTVLAMWGVTLIDVPQWISLHRLCAKLSALLSLHAGTLSLQRGGRSYLKDIKQICRAGEHKRSCGQFDRVGHRLLQPTSSGPRVRVGSFFFFFFLERTTDGFGTDLKCECSTWLSVSSSLWQEILWKKTTTCQNSQSASWEREGRRWEEILATLTLGYVCDRELRYLVTQAFLYAEHILRRHLSRAPVLGSDTSRRFVAD